MGTLIEYATAPNKTAQDGDGEHSPFTAALLNHISDSNAEIQEMFMAVRHEVKVSTLNTQIPWEASDLDAHVVLNPVSRSPLGSQPVPVRNEDAGSPESANSGTKIEPSVTSAVHPLHDFTLRFDKMIVNHGSTIGEKWEIDVFLKDRLAFSFPQRSYDNRKGDQGYSPAELLKSPDKTPDQTKVLEAHFGYTDRPEITVRGYWVSKLVGEEKDFPGDSVAKFVVPVKARSEHRRDGLFDFTFEVAPVGADRFRLTLESIRGREVGLLRERDWTFEIWINGMKRAEIPRRVYDTKRYSARELNAPFSFEWPRAGSKPTIQVIGYRRVFENKEPRLIDFENPFAVVASEGRSVKRTYEFSFNAWQ